MKKSLLLLTGAMVFLLAACGDTATDETSEEETMETAEPVTISVVTTFAGEDTNAGNYLHAIEAWQAETGNIIEDASATSAEVFKTRVVIDFEMGAEPDVLFYFNGADSNPFVEAGKVVSVDEIRSLYPDYASNMVDSKLGASPVDGKNYSIPVNGYWEGLFVNKEVCKAAGVEIPGADTTWEEFMEICQTIKEAGYIPIAASFAEIPHYWFEFCVYNFLDPASHNTLPKSLEDRQGQAWIDGINDMKTFYESGFLPENTLLSTDGETFQMFIDGKAAFLLDGSWKVGGIEGAAENIDDFTVTYVPGKNDRKSTDIIGGLSQGWYITRKAWEDEEKQKVCVDFVSYMTSDEMVSKFASVSTSSLKNDLQIDRTSLSSLAIASLDMLEGATGIASSVADQVTQENRAPVFNRMPDIVTGRIKAADAVKDLIDMMAESGEEDSPDVPR